MFWKYVREYFCIVKYDFINGDVFIGDGSKLIYFVLGKEEIGKNVLWLVCI